MAVPGRSGAYAGQGGGDDVGDAVSFALDDAQWTNDPLEFKVNLLPPGFTTDGQSLGGVIGCQMQYTIFVQGINSDGASDFVPLDWAVDAVAVPSVRYLFGLSIAWPAVPAVLVGPAVTLLAVTPGVKDISGPIGSLYVNDVPVDGTSARYDAGFRGNQLILSGLAPVFLRASAPGWEVILDYAS